MASHDHQAVPNVPTAALARSGPVECTVEPDPPSLLELDREIRRLAREIDRLRKLERRLYGPPPMEMIRCGRAKIALPLRIRQLPPPPPAPRKFTVHEPEREPPPMGAEF